MSQACHRNATKPSRFAHFWQGAQSLAPAMRNDIWTSKSGPNPSDFYTFDFEMCFAPQWRALFRHLNFQKRSERGVFCTFWLGNVLRATTGNFSTSQLQKVLQTWCVLHMEMCFAPQRRALFRHLNFPKLRTWCVLHSLTSKCASRHNGVHFFDISTSQSAPNMVCFAHFDIEMRFACTFSTSQLLKVFRRWGVWYILTWKCALRHNGVQLFISHLTAWLRTRRFSEPTFRPSGAPEPQIIGKTQCFATFLPFHAPGSSFFWDFLFFDLLSSSLLFADSSHLCFSFVHIVGSLTPKLPSIN